MSDDRAYRVHVAYDAEKKHFVARVPELDLSSTAATRAEAVTDVEHALEQMIATSVADKQSMPPAIDSQPVESALTLKLAPAVVHDLMFHARASGLAVEEVAAQLLARAIGTLDGGRFAARRRPEGSAPERERASADPERGPSKSFDDRDRDDRGNRRGPPGGGGRGRPREGYRPELDDKANFLEYLRGLEKGGGGRGRR